MFTAPQTTTLVHGSSPPRDLAAALATRGLEVSEPALQQRTVLDSFDGRLHAAGMSLQHVAPEDRLAESILVLSTEGSVPASVPLPAAPRRPTDLPVGPMRERLADILEIRALLPVLTFADHVTEAVQRDGRGSIVAGATIHAIDGFDGSVVEVTATAGHERPAEQLAEALVDLGCEPSTSSMIDLVAGSRHVDRRGFDSSPDVELHRDIAALDGFRLVFTNLATTIAANLPGTIDDLDTEFLHDLRVAIRRTRSVLGLGKGVLTDTARERYRTEFAWLAGTTGPVRDLDVYVLEWDRAVGHLATDRARELEPVLQHLQRHREVAQRQLVEDLRSDRAVGLLEEWRAGLSDLEPGPRAERRLGDIVASRIQKAYDVMIEAGRQIDEHAPAEALHDLRKDAKKLRYAVECFGDLLPTARRKAFVRQLKELQDNLGRHQDAEVHSAELQVIAGELAAEHATAPTLLALGQLIEHLELEKVSARAEFGERFASFDATSTHRMVAELVDAISS